MEEKKIRRTVYLSRYAAYGYIWRYVDENNNIINPLELK